MYIIIAYIIIMFIIFYKKVYYVIMIEGWEYVERSDDICFCSTKCLAIKYGRRINGSLRERQCFGRAFA